MREYDGGNLDDSILAEEDEIEFDRSISQDAADKLLAKMGYKKKLEPKMESEKPQETEQERMARELLNAYADWQIKAKQYKDKFGKQK